MFPSLLHLKPMKGSELATLFRANIIYLKDGTGSARIYPGDQKLEDMLKDSEGKRIVNWALYEPPFDVAQPNYPLDDSNARLLYVVLDGRYVSDFGDPHSTSLKHPMYWSTEKCLQLTTIGVAGKMTQRQREMVWHYNVLQKS